MSHISVGLGDQRSRQKHLFFGYNLSHSQKTRWVVTTHVAVILVARQAGSWAGRLPTLYLPGLTRTYVVEESDFL